jgi:hypothetical protein
VDPAIFIAGRRGGLRRTGERLLELLGGARDLTRDVLTVFDAGLVLRGERGGKRPDQPEWCAQRLIYLTHRRPSPGARVVFPYNVRHVVLVIDRFAQN